MSKTNPNYKHVITWLNKLPTGRIFTKEDAIKNLSETLDKNYICQIIIALSSKEFYIGKNFKQDGKRKCIDSYYKKKNIPTDKTLEDIKWFLRTGID